MVYKNRGVYGFLYPSWVLINVAPRNLYVLLYCGSTAVLR